MKVNEKLKENISHTKGITLIALVVTIIVLLILAGIAINLTIGNNGLFVRAKNASEKAIIGEETDIIKLAYEALFTDYIVDGTEITTEKLQEEINKSKTSTINEESEIPEGSNFISNGLSEGKIFKISMEYDYYMYVQSKEDNSKKFFIDLYNGDELEETLTCYFEEEKDLTEWFESERNIKLKDYTTCDIYPGGMFFRTYSFNYESNRYEIGPLMVDEAGNLIAESKLENGKRFRANKAPR